jgi:hypothetical protein
LRETDPDLAFAWRDAAADAIEACRSAGLVAGGFTDDATYVFGADPAATADPAGAGRGRRS